MNAKYLLITVAWSIAAFAQEAPPQPADQSAPPPSASAQRSAADLQKLVESIALYPDPLLAVMLPAAAYPVEVVQAARYVTNTNNLATLDDQAWDANVKAVARFPSVIQKMSDDLAWTVDLGQAFVEQPAELMDAIQALRAQAQSVGTLQTTPQQVVTVTNAVVERTYETQIVYVTNTIVQIMPANPQIVYVPVYSPTIVYAPPPTYVYSPAVPLVTFGIGIAFGAIIANNHCNWYYGGVYYGRSGFVVYGRAYGRYPYYPPPPHYRPPPYRPPPGYRPPPPGYRPPGLPPPGRPTPYPTQWQPDQNRLSKNRPAGAANSIATRESRGWGSSQTRPANQPAAATRPATPPGNIGSRPNIDTGGNRPTTGAAGSRPSAGSTPAYNQPVTRPSPAPANPSAGTGTPRPAQNPSINQPVTRPSPAPANPGAGAPRPAPNPSARPNYGRAPSSGGALSDLSSGAGAQNASNRGAASRGNGNSRPSGNSRGGNR